MIKLLLIIASVFSVNAVEARTCGSLFEQINVSQPVTARFETRNFKFGFESEFVPKDSTKLLEVYYPKKLLTEAEWKELS
ncbi:MAG: hypothetical protein V4596_00845, partial [Bdellovibrionota bacterium]